MPEKRKPRAPIVLDTRPTGRKPESKETDPFAVPEEDEFAMPQSPILPAGKTSVQPAAAPASKPVAVAAALKRRPRMSDPLQSAISDPGEKTAMPGTRRRVNLDANVRKLNKKQTGQLAQWRGANHGRQVDDYFRGQMDEARKKFGNRAVLAGTPQENVVIGIPCPSLAFEYLICQDVFPVGLILSIVGPPGSLKSALLYEIFHWFHLAGGGGHLHENETKFSPDLMQSIIRYRDDQVAVLVDRCNSVEEWQQKNLYWIDDNKKKLTGTKEAPGPGRTIPICYGVDSVMGKASYETQEKVQEVGYGGRNFPIEALSITNYMKTVPQLIDGWPFTIILNHHLKVSKNDKGQEEKRTAGGSGVNFQESFRLETSIRKRGITCGEWDGVVIKIACTKNSFGATHRHIDARLLWWEEPDEKGLWRQRSKWDWHWSTVHMLTQIVKEGRAALRLKEMGVHVAATKVSDIENAAWSKNLGMKQEDAISWSDLGEKIAQDADMMYRIRTALGIKQRPLLEGDYREQTEKLMESMP